jgi:hypothetical protein
MRKNRRASSRPRARATVSVEIPRWLSYSLGVAAIGGLIYAINRRRTFDILDPFAGTFDFVTDPIKRLFRSDAENDIRDSLGLKADVEMLKKDFEMLR